MRAVIIACQQKTGRCPLCMVRPRPLFPLDSGVLLDITVRMLHKAGIDEAIICTGGRIKAFRNYMRLNPTVRKLDLHDDRLLRGSAGCLQDVAGFVGREPFLVVESDVFVDGGLPELIESHRKNRLAITVGAVPSSAWRASDGIVEPGAPLAPLGAYVMQPEVLEHIPEVGDYDIKGQLLPKLAAGPLGVSIVKYRGRHRRVFDPSSYAGLVTETLFGVFGDRPLEQMRQIGDEIWAGERVSIAKSARLVGPLVLCGDVTIGEKAFVRGPSLLCENVVVKHGAAVMASILWSGAVVGDGSVVEDAILADSFRVAKHRRLSCSVAASRRFGCKDVHALMQSGYTVSTTSTLPKHDGQEAAMRVRNYNDCGTVKSFRSLVGEERETLRP